MNKKGFTLVEILAVIAIIGLLALIMIPNFIDMFQESNKNSMKVQENQIVDATKLLLEDYCIHPLNTITECSNVSMQINNSSTLKMYSRLDTLQGLGYIDDVVFGSTKCKGFVTYTKEADSKLYKDYKPYIKCGNAYETDGIRLIKNSSKKILINTL